MSDAIDLAQGILDHQLVDVEERRCGKVDDLELAGIAEGRPRVSELLVGRGRKVHVPWSAVEKIDSAIHLGKTASELRLGAGDRRAARFIAWIPGARAK